MTPEHSYVDYHQRYREFTDRRLELVAMLVREAEAFAESIDDALSGGVLDSGGLIAVRTLLVVDIDELRREMAGIRRQHELMIQAL